MVRTTTCVVWGKVDVSGGMGKAATLGDSVGSNELLGATGGALSRTIAGVSCGGNTRGRRDGVSDCIRLVRWIFDQIICEYEENQNNAARSARVPARTIHGLHHLRGCFPV